DDLGKELTVDVTITKPNGGTDTASNITVGTVKKANKIEGWSVEISNSEPLVGDTVIAEISSDADGWTPAYQWKLTDKNGNTTNISGATSASYKITSANVGKTLTVEVKLTRAGYETPEPNVSPGVELKSTFDNFTPAISGSVLLGSALSVTGLPSASTYPNTTPLYSWKVAGIEVGTEATYTIAEADLGKSITVTVTMAGQGYTSKSATSAVLAIDNGSIAAFTPVLTGIAKVDSVLVVTGIPDVYSPANGYAVTYQWLRNGTAISKAITSTYRLNSSDLGAAVSVRVTLNKSGYDQLVVVSGALTVEKADEKASDPEVPAGTVTPVITAGAAGDTITPGDKVTAGEIPEGYTATYQWQRDGKQISGATKSSYTLVNGDQGHTLTVVVTLSKDGYSDTAFASAGVTVLEKTAVFTPKITGTAKVGKTLTATGAPSGWTVKYQWLRDGKKISKATKSTYKVVSADSGHKLTVRMTATKSGYTKTVKTSAVKSQAKLKATLTLKIPTAKANKSAKVTITVTAPGIKKPNGKVSVKVNGVTKTVNVKKGKATFKTPKLKKGSYKITVKWMSNAEIKSASKKGTLKVK
ncbi:MAG: hypothetical protein LBR21_00490, partial [Propionibacteriaceae bacterium]|nr:hypothetical protein [Propionibacteriaceae bacterium]